VTHPVAINNHKEITGYFCYDPCSYYQGFLRDKDGTFITFEGFPSDINDEGTIVGSLYDGQHVFLRDRHGNTTVFYIASSTFPYAAGQAVALNDEDEIVGYSILQPGSDYFDGWIIDSKGVYEDFYVPEGGFPTGINRKGEISGYTYPYNGPIEGYIRDRNGTITIFDALKSNLCPFGDQTYTSGINDKGEIAGTVLDCVTGVHGYVRTRHGQIIIIDPPEATYVDVQGINDRGTILGSFIDPLYGYSDFLLDERGNLEAFDLPGTATSFNNHDDIVGYTSIVGFVRSHRVRDHDRCDRTGHDE
jgi:hypothetical protein